MKAIGIVGGGMMGLTLAHRLNKRGFRVSVFEASAQWGGLCSSHDYGDFVWDKFYHCIMPQDESLLGLLCELGLSKQVYWQKTQTAYFHKGTFYPMSSHMDFMRFPLLSTFEKTKFGYQLFKIKLFPPKYLHMKTAAEWLTATFGTKIYQIFWAPLLRSKFGDYQEQVSADFFYSLLNRAWQARHKNGIEKLGYLDGGYKFFFNTMERHLIKSGVQLHLNHKITQISLEESSNRCVLTTLNDKKEDRKYFDWVFYTGPLITAKSIADNSIQRIIQMSETTELSPPYLGVVCAVYVLNKNLTPYYLVNIGDQKSFLTGCIEMGNLVDPKNNFNDRSLLYLPKYVDSYDPIFEMNESTLFQEFEKNGLNVLFPHIKNSQIIKVFIHKERFVQPLTLASDKEQREVRLHPFSPPFQILNSAMTLPSNLYNDAVVKFVNTFVSEINVNETN